MYLIHMKLMISTATAATSNQENPQKSHLQEDRPSDEAALNANQHQSLDIINEDSDTCKTSDQTAKKKDGILLAPPNKK